jgi:hypothetical protein
MSPMLLVILSPVYICNHVQAGSLSTTVGSSHSKNLVLMSSIRHCRQMYGPSYWLLITTHLKFMEKWIFNLLSTVPCGLIWAHTQKFLVLLTIPWVKCGNIGMQAIAYPCFQVKNVEFVEYGMGMIFHRFYQTLLYETLRWKKVLGCGLWCVISITFSSSPISCLLDIQLSLTHSTISHFLAKPGRP